MSNFITDRRRRVVTSWLTSVDTPNKSNICPSSEYVNTLSIMDEEDPWTWGVDRVVQELCTNNRTWPALSATQLLPDPVQLEINLREQEMDGPFLMTGVTNQVLRDEFGLVGPRSVKQRTTILHAISHFRGKSQH